MQKHFKLFATAAILTISVARPADARQDEQLWTSASANVKLSDTWRLSQEFTARFSNRRNGLYEIEGVTLLGYKLSNSVTIAGGYVHNPQFSEGDFTVLGPRLITTT